MRKSALAILVAVVLLAPAWAFAAQPTQTGNQAVVAPARPTALTGSQFTALRRLEIAPEHNKVLGLSASYASERERSLAFTRASDDFWTVVYDVGWPGAYLTVLLCAL